MTANQLSMFEGDAAAGKTGGKMLSFSLAKTINASRQKVFDQWLIPVFIGDWMFGPDRGGDTIVNLENTVRKGGEFAFTVTRSGEEVQYSGSYLQLDIPNRLVFSWTESPQPELESQLTVQFDEQDGKTRLKLGCRIPEALAEHKDDIKKLWSTRCAALAAKLKS